MPIGRGPRGPRHPARWAGANRLSTKIWTLTGQVIAINGAAIAGVTVDLFESSTRLWVGTTTTDASGIFTFHPATNTVFMAVADYVSGTEQAGCTIRNLVPS